MAENITSIETGSGIVYKFTENLIIYVTDITPTIDTDTKITAVPTGIYTSRSTVNYLVRQSGAYDVDWMYSYGSAKYTYGKWTIIDGQIWVTLGTGTGTGFYPDKRGGYITIYCGSDIICFYD